MKRACIVALALVVTCGFGVSAAFAGPGCCKSKEAKTASASCSATAGDFPKLVMMVGDETFGCPKSAESAAKEHDAKIVYVVAGEKFECKDKAQEALACASESYVKRFTSIATVADGKVLFVADKCSSACSSSAATASAKGEKKCCLSKSATAKAESSSCCKSKSNVQVMTQSQIDGEVKNAKSVKYMVLGKSYDCPKAASKARDEALAAIKLVSMKYVVDGKEVGSSEDVCPMAKKAGKVQYVVGNEKSDCETSARVTLAKAQFEAAKKAAEKQVAAM